MDFNEYQKQALKTAIYPNLGANLQYPTLGLCGETGEVAELVKKSIRDEGGEVSPERREKLIKELGDVLWYCAMLAHELGIPLSTVAEENMQKLADRQARNKIKGDGDER
ncbi:MAG: nucleoside triphosphate pyrophosphohydrolase family protein [Acidobacteria bacterium]|nr:nucleoside triphosphate pyrophosphohydrolase family protein [Acidobacteriota bacterium]